jgi:cytochrome c-type biogenesis protein CcmH
MLFWILAAVGLALMTFIACLPLFRNKSGWTPIALALVFALPAAALFMYQGVGSPEGIDVTGIPQAGSGAGNDHSMNASDADQIEDMAAKLRSRLTESPEDLEGWVLLARTLKTMQRFEEAVDALETARRIAPDDPFVAVELVEARIFVSADGEITDEMLSMLQAALDQDPSQQKALWLMGIAASQAGEDDAAISYWETLLQMLEPDSGAAQSVQQQINEAKGRLGLESESGAGSLTESAAPAGAEILAEAVNEIEATPESVPAAETTAASTIWAGTNIRIQPGSRLDPETASAAVLYVMIRSPGPAVGPPLGVRRIRSPQLPLELAISDQDSMIKERLISSMTEVQLQARLSMSGAPQARSGDWQSTSVTVPLDSTEAVELLIDQQVE